MLKRPTISLLAILAVFAVSGCATSNPILTMDTTTTTYAADELTRTDLASAQVAILPVLAGQGFEGFRRQAGRALNKAFARELPDAQVIPFGETLERINSAGLSSEYSDMMEGYSRTGIIDQEALASLSGAIGAQYLVYSRVGREETAESQMIGSGNMRAMHTSKVQSINIYAQLWDAMEADVVWEGVGGAAAVEGETGSDMNTLIRKAASSAAKCMARPEMPCRGGSADELHKRSQEQASANYTRGMLMLGAILLPIYVLLSI